MQDRRLKLSFDQWLVALRLAAAAPDRQLTDADLQRELSLPSPDAAQYVRRRVRSAVRDGSLDFLTEPPAARRVSARRYSPPVPPRSRGEENPSTKRSPEHHHETPISEWYAPHRS
jgi:hypothetical protein